MEDLRFFVARCEGLRVRAENEGRFLLYNPRTDELHLIGPLEKAIFDLCDGRSIDDVLAAAGPLFEQHGQDSAPETLTAEVLAFLQGLYRRSLISYQ